MNKRVLIIDDDLSSCKKIKEALQDESTDVEYLLSSHEVFEHLKNPALCLIIVDIHIRETDGLELLRAIRRFRPIPVLVLSAVHGRTDRIDAFQAGAQGYMEKPFELNECVAYARSMIQFYTELNTGKSKYYTLVFDNTFFIDPGRHQAVLQGDVLSLTPKEFHLLYYLASHAGQVLSREQIYTAVWKEDAIHDVDEVVKAHIKAIRKKLTPLGRNYIKTERGIGYRFSPQSDWPQ